MMPTDTEIVYYLLRKNKFIDGPIDVGLKARINFHDDAVWESALLVFLPL